ncbi:hypothetical protein [Streptomyces mangrovi]|uniref:hypothetical protein n=1 Tax=Streptomyces mangrovi TaxID=1206892 RepID=UPI00399C7E6F
MNAPARSLLKSTSATAPGPQAAELAALTAAEGALRNVGRRPSSSALRSGPQFGHHRTTERTTAA